MSAGPDSLDVPSLADLKRELVERTARIAPTDGIHESLIRGLTFVRASVPSPLLPSLYRPSLCIVVQGRKRALLADEVYIYDPLNYLVVSVTLAMRGQIIEATPDLPYLCMRIGLDRKLIGELLSQLGPAPVSAGNGTNNNRGLFLARSSTPFLDSLVRLLRLLDEPRHAAVLAPLVLREIHYRALVGELGDRLRELCAMDTQAQRIDSAIQLLVEHFAEPLSIEDLATAAHMSLSTLHHRFKAITAMSPMQFQKQLRLHEARRLMLSEGFDAATAAHRVGYESASQFSREYRRLFGAPPRRDTELMRYGASSV
jgi:AraC-like DNA-binding protein